jgi:hypothetical protein
MPILQRWLSIAFDFTPFDEPFPMTLHSFLNFAKEGLDMNLTKTKCFQPTQDFGITAHL